MTDGLVERLAKRWTQRLVDSYGANLRATDDARWWLNAFADEIEVMALEDDEADVDAVYSVTARLRTEAERR